MLQKPLEEFLLNQLTESRNELFNSILPHRTRHVTVVLENFFQPHNFSAVLRSCDCFGIHDVHIIENENNYQRNPKINMGSDKWLNIKRHNALENNTKACIDSLKADGYKIVAAHPHGEATPLQNLNLNHKTAIIFGTEKAGISDIVKENVDEYMTIPMFGFTESFNVSVAAALTLNHIKHQLMNSTIDWQLSPNDKGDVLEMWLQRNVKDYEKLRLEWLSRADLAE